MPKQYFHFQSCVFAILPCIIAAITGCAQTASHGTIDGKYLVALSGLPQLEVKTPNETAIWITPDGDAISIVGDENFTVTYKSDAFFVKVRECTGEGLPPVWFRFYDGPNMFAKANFEEITFDMPVTKSGLPAIFNQQSKWDQMGIFQPIPVFSDVAPTYCGFSGPKTIWANGGHNFELVAGNTGFDVGDATPVTVWNSPWENEFDDTLYKGWMVYPMMALGNGNGALPAGYAFRTLGSMDNTLAAKDSMVHCKYTVLNDKEIMLLELSYNGATTKYAVPQKLFKDKFLPLVIASGAMAADDKQVAQVNDFMWRWMLFTTTCTIQKPTNPDGKLISLDELKQYFPLTTKYLNVKTKVKGYDGINNPAAFENTLQCGLGMELFGTLFDFRLFTDVPGYSKWLATEADKKDPRYAHWRCVEAIMLSREQRCKAEHSEDAVAGAPWHAINGYMNEQYPKECDCNDPETKAIIAGLRSK